MKTRRFQVVILALVLSAAGATAGCTTKKAAGTNAAGKTITIRYAVALGPNTAPGVSARTFQKDIQSQSGGKIKVNLYYTGDLGANQDVMDQTVAGTVQMYTAATSFLQQTDPNVTIDELPYLFANYDQATAFWSGPVGAAIKTDIQQKAGVRVLNAESFGFHDMLSKTPINSVGSFHGLKIQTSNTIQTNWATTLGMTTVNVPLGNAYTAVQQGLINSLDQAFDASVAQKWYEVLKYATESNDIYSTGLGFVNEKFWETLPAADQTMIQNEMTKLQSSEIQYLQQTEQNDQDQMKAHGVTFTVLSPAVLAQLKAKMAPIYAKVGTSLGPTAAQWLSQWQASSAAQQ
jgi:TRAP-type transport system periplasmic protein